MPKIVAYRCPVTGKVFTNRDNYIKNLKKQRHLRNINRSWKYNERRIQRELGKVRSFNELVKWIEDNSRILWDQAVATKSVFLERSGITFENRDKFRIEVLEMRISRSEMVSNSHGCPRGGITNWTRDPKKTMGYPGWHGRFSFKIVSENPCSFSSELFKGTGIRTGSGGGGGNGVYGYGVEIFEDDFPGLKEEYTHWKTLCQIDPDQRNPLEKFNK